MSYLTKKSSMDELFVSYNDKKYMITNIIFYTKSGKNISVGRGWFGESKAHYSISHREHLKIPKVAAKRTSPKYDGSVFIIRDTSFFNANELMPDVTLYMPFEYWDFKIKTHGNPIY